MANIELEIKREIELLYPLLKTKITMVLDKTDLASATQRRLDESDKSLLTH